MIPMIACCESCNKLAEHKYWNNKGTDHQFFKIILCDFEHHLRIPKKFVERFNGELSGWCVLRGPSGSKWIVNMKKTSNDTLFLDGWDKFVKDHGLKTGHLLFFSYDGASEFKVTIFDGTSCEVESSHFIINIESSSSSCHRSCSSALHGIVGDGLESKDDDNYDVDDDDDDADEKSYSVQEEHYMLRYDDDDDDDDDDNDDDDDDYEEEEEEEDMFYDKKGKTVHGLKSKSSSVKQRRPLNYKSNRRQVTANEKQRAKQLALDYVMKNERHGPPMFQVTLLPTHVYRGFHLTIPKEWALRHMHGQPHYVELRVPTIVGCRWLVGCRWSRSRQCQLIRGWAKFVVDNNLEEHDICVFELLRGWEKSRTGYPLFHVHIFQVVEQPYPFMRTKR